MRVLIVDDEAPARAKVRRYLQEERGVEVVGEATNGVEAVEAIEELAPDLVLLDVQMPELDGFGVVAALEPATLPVIVFVTAFDRYALRACEVHASDYLLKPFTAERLRAAVQRARELLQGRAIDDSLASFAQALRERPRYISRVSVRVSGRIVLVDLSAVDWIEAEDNYVRLHAGARSYLHRETLAALEKQLDPDRFARIHRSAIVQIDRIVELHPATHGDMDIVLRTGKTLPLSRTYREALARVK